MAPRPTAPSARRSPPFIGMPSSSVGNSPSTMDNNGHHHHPHRVDKDVEMFNADADAEAESETTPQMQQPRGRNGLRRVALEHLAQGGRQPEGQADRAANLYTNFDVNVPQLSSSLVVPIGPLAAAAENGMSAVEEAAQGSGPGRRASLQHCPSGGLSQKITVPVQGVVMVQLKEVTNAMDSSTVYIRRAIAVKERRILSVYQPEELSDLGTGTNEGPSS
ncbi:uncharacterized protein B0H18DRAFT_1116116 [Fomitopsis serialis]|uniref:uncharacterized protein n=1 Tax=Fomitopsis serialis TaxID=139415 RepID=UPI00200870C8|nr:uncharacterized protein B0H18DRAFT_1116116 [Neoantrodia serialis]KAH9931863.1 hypothetical protein B0H18DRAFT_1116116 [Neoantrodia serialis]